MLLAVATPMLMIAPIIEGTFSVVWVTNSISTMPASAPGSAIRMMNGSSHDWKFTTITKYTSSTANTSPTPSPINELRMVETCPRVSMKLPLGSLGVNSASTRPHRCATAAQVAILHVGVDVVERLHVVVIDHRGRGVALQLRHVGEQLRGRPRAG